MQGDSNTLDACMARLADGDRAAFTRVFENAGLCLASARAGERSTILNPSKPGKIPHRPLSTLGFGLATLTAGVAMLWYGREPQKAVLPGIAAGLVPLVFALCANQIHACGPDGCGSLCVPACTLGGVVAGLAVAGVGNQRKAGPWFWISASSLALLTGAMACMCVGYSGIVLTQKQGKDTDS